MGSRPELKVDDEFGFIKFYRNLPKDGDNTVRIFSRGDFYTAHGEDAVFIASSVSPVTDIIIIFRVIISNVDDQRSFRYTEQRRYYDN